MMKLQPFLELGKQITGSSLCEIDIADWNYQWILADIESDFRIGSQSTSVYYDTLGESSSLEIEDLSKESRYKDLYYGEGKPHLRYYFGVKLTTSDGKDIGAISVLDPVAKRINKKQKVQFKLLAHAVMMAIESERSHHAISGELESLKMNLQRLNHDVRSPINGITGLADLLIQDKEEVKVRTRDILMIKKAAQSIVDIVSGSLAEVNLEKNKENLPERKPLSDVLEKIEKLFNPLAQNKNVNLSIINNTGHKTGVPYDFSIKLLRIVGNLVSNAIKFSPENGEVVVQFNNVGNKNQTFLGITVKNTGKSMSSDQIHSFNSGDAVERSNGHGKEKSFGLGLQHVYQMVTEEGGRAEAQKGKGAGTIFSVTLSIPEDDQRSGPYVNVGYLKPTVNGKDESQKRAT